MDAFTTPLPKAWQRVKLGDILELLTDYHANGSYEILKNNVTLLKNVDFAIMIRTTNFENNDFKNDLIYIDKKAYEFLSKSKVFAGDILVNKIANAGTAYFMPKLNQPVSLGMNLFLLRIKPSYNNLFIFKQIANYERVLKTFANGSATKTITKNVIKNLLIPLPPLNEQIAIANILSALDRYLYSLDALILKKESVKKALSFELLSQRKRLKGFNQNWQRVRLGDICEITTGSLDANEMVHYGKYRFYTCAKEYYFIDKYAFDTEAILISGNGAYVGYVHYYKGKFNAYQRTYVLDNFSEHIIFVKYFLTIFLQSHIQTNRNEGNTPYIVMATLKDFEILLPPLNEQIAIANILSALDNEIISLKNKKRQFENIKKALNHDLM
ncbi:restriction endonuclease subunit S, partial [Helicobacter pylori]|uniref:restriction endonuclease subunit S n=1 Tax=Helicobacter pylori TaxID=210 RepID=UPI0013F406C7